MRAKVVQVLHVLMRAGMGCDRKQAVVGHPIPAILALLGLDHPDKPDGDHTPDRDGLIHEHQYIQRVAVLAQRGRDEAEIVRKRATSGMTPASLKAAQLS